MSSAADLQREGSDRRDAGHLRERQNVNSFKLRKAFQLGFVGAAENPYLGANSLATDRDLQILVQPNRRIRSALDPRGP